MPRALCELVHGGRIDARIDRAAHQHHGMGNIGVLRRLHAGDRRHHRHRRLAHRQHMHVAVQEVQHRDHVVDIVVEVEPAFGERHHAGVGPIGDIDVVVRQQAFHGPAQQRGIVTRHRRHDQQARLRPARPPLEGTLEMQEAAERPLPDRGDVDRDAFAADQGGVDPPFGLAVAAGRALEHLAGRRHGLAELGMGHRIGRILEEQPGRIRQSTGRIERGLAHLVEPVIRPRQHRAMPDHCGRSAAEFPNCHRPGP